MACFCKSKESCTCRLCPRCGNPDDGHFHDPPVGVWYERAMRNPTLRRIMERLSKC